MEKALANHKLSKNIEQYQDFSEQELINRRDTLKMELLKVETKLITLNSFLKKGYDSRYDFHFAQRKEKAAEKQNIQIEIASINALLKKGRQPRIAQENIMKQLFAEVFGHDMSAIFYKELNNRACGGTPNKIAVNFDKVLTAKHRALQADYIKVVNKMEDARKTIDAWIRHNEPAINKGDYLEYVKEVAFSLPPMSEIIKLKRFTP